MMKFLAGIAIIVVVAAGAFYVLNTQTPTPAPHPMAQAPTVAATSTYATTTFSVVYPSDYSIDPDFSNVEVSDKKPISGVKFTIPGSMATGTNLSSDTFLSVEKLPRAKRCTGDIYLRENVISKTLVDGGVTYSLATTSQGAAGTRSDEYVYAFVGSSPCIAVRYTIRYGDIGKYPPGTVHPFDQAALLSAFDGIRRSVSLFAGGSEQANHTSASSSTSNR